LSKILKQEFKIDISEDILKKIFEDWDKSVNADYSIFKKEDKDWMDAWAFQGYLKRKTKDKQSFGKHRKKDTGYTGVGRAVRDWSGWRNGVGYGEYWGD
jgi:hypothetical protein